MRERGSGSACLEARWKKGGTVVDDVLKHRGISIGRRTTGQREGGETINTQHSSNTNTTHGKHNVDGALTQYTVYCSEREIHPGTNYRLRVITGQGVRRGKGSCRRCRGHPTHVWVVYPGYLIYSEQLSCLE